MIEIIFDISLLLFFYFYCKRILKKEKAFEAR